MKKVSILLLIFSGALFIPVFCFAQSNQTESLTITTYYPSPYGVYKNLRLHPTAEPTTGVDAGVMYYDTGLDLIRYYNKTNQWVNLTGGGGGGADPLQVRRIVVGDVNGDGNINAADIPANSRPLYVQGPSPGINTAAFVNTNRYGVAIGGEDGLTYGQIQSDRFTNGVGNDPSVTNLVINGIGGNVGIGTANPQQKLDVAGQVHASGDICTDAGGGQCLSTSGGSIGKLNCIPSYCDTGGTGCNMVCGAGYTVTGCAAGGNAYSTATFSSCSCSASSSGTGRCTMICCKIEP